MDYLADKIGRDSETELNLNNFAQEVVTNKSSEFAEKIGKSIAEEIERFWDTLE